MNSRFDRSKVADLYLLINRLKILYNLLFLVHSYSTLRCYLLSLFFIHIIDVLLSQTDDSVDCQNRKFSISLNCQFIIVSRFCQPSLLLFEILPQYFIANQNFKICLLARNQPLQVLLRTWGKAKCRFFFGHDLTGPDGQTLGNRFLFELRLIWISSCFNWLIDLFFGPSLSEFTVLPVKIFFLLWAHIGKD